MQILLKLTIQVNFCENSIFMILKCTVLQELGLANFPN